MSNPVQHNPLRTRDDVVKAVGELLEPLFPLFTEGNCGLHIGETGAVYTAEIAEMEGFARPLWAIIPMLLGQCETAETLFSHWKEGIINGVNPNHEGYWGEVVDYDQRLVEMAVFGMGMALTPDKFYFSLPKTAQENLYTWLNQINHHDIPKNNWIFFRVLVNMGFMVCGLNYSQKQLDEDLALIETHYDGDGWYNDYINQRDYYTLWAFHFYGLVYAHVMKEKDPERSQTFVERSKKAAPLFACWFDSTGEAIPYGRSLTYRFAQGAFFSALAWAEIETPEVDYGVMKHILLGHLRNWFKNPIFTRDGVLTIGYHYPNLLMAEGYNAPGGIYWAMKAFICLALPAEHPFWTAEEKAFTPPERSLQKQARMLITHSKDNRHVMAFTAGNRATEHSHDEAKYEKFVYSTVFGFSVPKSQKLLRAGAFDNMLAVSEEGFTYHPRYHCENYELTENYILSTWHPFKGVTIESKIIPVGEWHVRIHNIVSDRELHVAEGGYAISRNGKGDVTQTESAVMASILAPWGMSAIYNLEGFETGTIVLPEPNTNLMVNRTYLPTLVGTVPVGKSRLVSVVYGSVSGEYPKTIPSEVLSYVQLG